MSVISEVLFKINAEKFLSWILKSLLHQSSKYKTVKEWQTLNKYWNSWIWPRDFICLLSRSQSTNMTELSECVSFILKIETVVSWSFFISIFYMNTITVSVLISTLDWSSKPEVNWSDITWAQRLSSWEPEMVCWRMWLTTLYKMFFTLKLVSSFSLKI